MNKKCLIIGGSGDIGFSTAKLLADEGMNVALQYFSNKEKIDRKKDTINPDRWIGAYYGELSTMEGIESFLDSVPDDWDMLVFAPGNHILSLHQDVSYEVMDKLYYVHVKALWMLTKKLLPPMIRKKEGCIVVVSSVWGEEGASLEAVYSSVKGAQISFVKGLAKETGPSGIRVNAVTPGFIDTPMNQIISSEDKKMITEEIPLGRLGTSEEVAKAIFYLLNDASSYVTGHVLKVNGGWY
ncbi:elongation factor P 5-aminopentanone reductase [Halobacillus sp. Marseille-Q1614]|uniref:elongation factor P 5-aminopentanone reductase n=1 Tax=Halobacillus sp. Marseille-Q1614 TaxID=2709134 RepID=UPI00156E70AE|nr:SDR family oxidoreductase [Halobacillus sp. Marseille-Q1614]